MLGTSLLHHLMLLAPNVSTMINKCNSLIGKKCLNWNHEGQWLLDSRVETTKYIQPGVMCPINTKQLNNTLLDTISASYQRQWEKYWNSEMPIFIEKSPQNIVKIPFLYQLFSKSFTIKFLIVLKHPITLNIATMKSFEWTTNRKHPNIESAQNTPNEISQLVDYFINFMVHNSTSGNNCDYGWLPGIERLHADLNSLPIEFSTSNVKIRTFYINFD